MKAEIIKLNDDGTLTVKLHEDLDRETLEKNAYNNRWFVYLEPLIKNTTTDDQRKHWFAIINDISDYTGEPKWKVILNMKYLYMVTNDDDKEPSLARNKQSKIKTRKLLKTAIEYALDNGIPLQHNYLTDMDSAMLFKMTMNRICWTCGKVGADLHHAEGTVGMGRDRTKIDHTKSKFMTLCRDCHNKAHAMGQDTFNERYHVQPISLSEEQLNTLGVM